MLSSAFWRIGARIASSGALGITLLLIARASPVGQFGQFVLTYSLALVVGIVIGFGAPARAMRSSAAVASVALQRSLFWLHTIVNVSVTAIALAVAAFLGMPATVVAGITFGASDTIQGYAQSHSAGLNLHREASLLIVTQRIAPCVSVIALLLSHNDNLYQVIAIAFAIPLLIGAIAPLRSSGRGSLDLSTAVRGSLHWWTFSLSNLLTQLQTPVVGAVAGTAIAGLFGIALRVTGPMTLLTASVATVVVPELSRRVGTPEFAALSNRIIKLSWGYLLICLLAAVPITYLVMVIAGPDYRPAAPLVVAMVIAAGLSGCSQAIGAQFMAINQPASATTAIAAGGVVALIGLAALGLTRDALMLAVVPVLAQIVVLTLMILAMRRLTYTAGHD